MLRRWRERRDARRWAATYGRVPEPTPERTEEMRRLAATVPAQPWSRRSECGR